MIEKSVFEAGGVFFEKNDGGGVGKIAVPAVVYGTPFRKNSVAHITLGVGEALTLRCKKSLGAWQAIRGDERALRDGLKGLSSVIRLCPKCGAESEFIEVLDSYREYRERFEGERLKAERLRHEAEKEEFFNKRAAQKNRVANLAERLAGSGFVIPFTSDNSFQIEVDGFYFAVKPVETCSEFPDCEKAWPGLCISCPKIKEVISKRRGEPCQETES